jgi:hypothetical protein
LDKKSIIFLIGQKSGVKIETAARTLYFLNANTGNKPMAVSPWGFNEVKGTLRRNAISIAQASEQVRFCLNGGESVNSMGGYGGGGLAVSD